MKLRVAITYNFDDKDWFGGRNYFASLIRSLQLHAAPHIELVFITGKKTETSIPNDFPFLEVIRTPMLDRMNPVWLIRQLTLRYFDTDPLLASFLRQKKIDVLSHSGYLGSNSGIKTIPWLFDFQFVHLPEHWTKRQLQWVKRRYMAACNQGDGIIVSSSDALSDLIAFAPKSRTPKYVLHFVSNPVDFSKILTKEEICQRYSLQDNYFYLPNQFWTHKNHIVAIDALALLKKAGVETIIVCTGQTKDLRDHEYFDKLMVRCHAAGVADNFKVLGVVPFSDAQSLMVHARAVLNPSRFEGWSTTVEEAKTLNKRLILSNIGVHREQSPEFGSFFAPDDAIKLAELMKNVLEEQLQVITEDEVTLQYAIRQYEFSSSYLKILDDITKNSKKAGFKQ